MTTYHVAVDHLDPATGQVTTTYLGECDQAHVDEVRAIAALPDTERWVKDDPRIPGAFMVLRDDGDLDVYVPTDAAPLELRQPDPDGAVETNAGGDLAKAKAKGPTKVRKAAAEPMAATVSGPAYIDGAVRFGDQSIGGAMDHPESGPRVTWHTTESPAGRSYFYSVAAYLIRVASEPQVIYDPDSDLIGQFGPLSQSARALRNDGARRTNREGRVNIQVEVLGRAKTPWTTGFDPAKKPNYRKLLTAARAHGVPDVWPAGDPPAYPSGKSARSRTVWQSKAGHYAHAQVPGNDHGDPGAIDTSITPGKAPSAPSKPVTPAKPAAQYEPFPGSSFFHAGRHSPIITAMGRRLVAVGCSAYQSGPGPDWTEADRRSYAKWQRKLGYTGSDADGYPGKKSWDALRVPNV
jgi:hypothetical protein